jgi:hypothetical protein
MGGWLAALPAAAQPTEHDEHKYSEWQSNEHTWFAASASDIGVIYLRPHLTLGYGAPFWQFVGFDGYALATNSFSAAYAGWRASLPFLDVQLGSRWNYPYDRRYLPRQSSFTADELGMRDGSARSANRVTELEVTPLAPLFGGVVFMEFHPIWFSTPGDQFVFEEVIRAVVAPPFAMRTRLGYVYKFGDGDRIKLGAMTEYLVLPGRPENVTRVGPLLLVTLAPRLEGLFTATFVVSSPDHLGLYESSYGFLGLRVRWAQRF